jgi:hypothetical protein
MTAKREHDAIWEQLTAEDFHGTTRFRELSVEQRLQWLSNAAAFALEARRARAATEAIQNNGVDCS